MYTLGSYVWLNKTYVSCKYKVNSKIASENEKLEHGAFSYHFRLLTVLCNPSRVIVFEL